MFPSSDASVFGPQNLIAKQTKAPVSQRECFAMTTPTTTTPPPSLSPTEMAKAYMDQGMMLVPEVSGTTRPRNSGWVTATINESNFAENFPSANGWNIGFRTGAEGNGFHDVDLDCLEAVQLAPSFLPETGWVFGRASNPRSHYVYKVTDGSTPTKKLVGLDGDVLVELRGDRSKTTAPPSFKAEPNEHVRWDHFNREDGPAEVSLEELKKAVTLLAIASLLLRSYPEPGARHGFVLALAGGLLRSGLSDVEISHLVLTVAEAAQDINLDDRRTELQTTFESYRQNKPTTGLPTLAHLLGTQGKSLIACMKKCLGFGIPTPPEPKIPLHALPVPLREIIEGISGSLDADPALSVLPLLTALGAAIGTTRAIRAKEDWTVFPFLWTAPVSDAGSAKTPSRNPISDILSAKEKERVAAFREALDAFEEDDENYQKARKSPDGDRPEKPVQPVAKCTFVSDITLESLSVKLLGNPKGILFWSEELTDLFSIPSRYSAGGGDVSRFNALFDGTPIRVSRKLGDSRERDLFLERPFLAISGGIQPGVLARVIKPEFLESGFLQRFLFVGVEPRLTSFQNRSIPQEAKEKLRYLFDILLEFQHFDDRHTPLIYRFTEDALLLFGSWVDYLCRLIFEEKEGHLKSALSKQRDLVLRLLVIFQTVHCVRFSLSPNTLVDVCMVSKAIVFSQWLIAEWSKVYHSLRSSRHEGGVEKLLTLVWSRSGGTGQARVRDLMRWNNRTYPTADQAATALQGLVDLGLAQIVGENPGAFDRTKSIQLLDDVGDFGEGASAKHPIFRFQPPAGFELAADCEPCRQGALGDVFEGPTHGETASSVLQAPPFFDLPRTPTEDPQNSVVSFTLVTDEDILAEAVAAVTAATDLALDLETTGLSPDTDRIRLITVTVIREVGNESTFVFDVFSSIDIQAFLNCIHEKTLYLHNASFDLGFLRRLGFVHNGPIHDTMLMARLLHAGTDAPCSLEGCTLRYLGIELSKEQQRSDWSTELTSDQLAYAASDTAHLFSLADRLLSELENAGLLEAYNLEMGCLLQVIEMGFNGVPIDTEVWLRLNESIPGESQSIKEELNQVTMNNDLPWNWNSPPQVQRAFQSIGVILTKTDDDTLAKCGHPLAALLRRYRKVQKLLSAYGDKWLNHLVGGRIHPNWKQVEAQTGRMACSKPNIQQLPKDRYRSAIAPGAGRVLIKADYSQIELRVLAEVTQDPKLLEAYLQGQDLHLQTAREVLQVEEVTREHRQLAKALNFGLAFGMGAKSFAQYAKSGYGVELTETEAKQHRAKFLRNYAGVKRWQDRTTSATAKLVPETRTLSGRRRLLDPGKGHTERLNSPIQGTAADGLKAALGFLWQRRDEMPEAKVIIACHDEIVVEAPGDQAEAAKSWLVTAMVEGMSRYVRSVPIVVEATIGDSWE